MADDNPEVTEVTAGVTEVTAGVTEVTAGVSPEVTEQSYVIPAVASSLVEDLTLFSNDQLVDKLHNIDIQFTCKVCQAKAPSLRALVDHLQRPGECRVRRPRGRPRKVPGQEPARQTAKHKPAPVPPPSPGRRATRMSTGAITRRSATELLGYTSVKMEPLDSDDEEYVRRYGRHSQADRDDEADEDWATGHKQEQMEADTQDTSEPDTGQVQGRTLSAGNPADADGQTHSGGESIEAGSQAPSGEKSVVAEGQAPSAGKTVVFSPDCPPGGVSEVDAGQRGGQPVEDEMDREPPPEEINTDLGDTEAASGDVLRCDETDLSHEFDDDDDEQKMDVDSSTDTSPVPEADHPPGDEEQGGDHWVSVVVEEPGAVPEERGGGDADRGVSPAPSSPAPHTPSRPAPHTATVSLIPQTVVDIASAQAEGQETRPVVTIRGDDARGSIVIPSSGPAGEPKTVVIPHSLLLSALDEHKRKNPDDSNRKTVLLISESATSDKEFDIKVKEKKKESSIQTLQQYRFSKEYKPPKAEGKINKALCRKSRPHKCRVCLSRHFATKVELKLHMDSHIYKSIDNRDTVADDSKNIIPPCDMRNKFKCIECPFEVDSWNRMVRHMIGHDNLKETFQNTRTVENIMGQFQCKVCKKEFGIKSNLLSHYRNVHTQYTRKCEICQTVFVNIQLKPFKIHVEKCKNVYLQCDQCPYRTQVSVNMKKHKLVHTDQAYTCEVCSKAFCTQQRLKQHKLKHDTNRPVYHCEYCEKPFLTNDAMKKHVARSHQETKMEFPCTRCSFVAKIATDLTRHEKLVHDKKYKCDEENCDYMTNCDKLFKSHQEYHKPNMIHKCPFEKCFFSASSESLLHEHKLNVHHSDGKHQCPVCLKNFKRKTHLLRHMVSHTGDKPYSCANCGLSFYSHSTYYRHRAKTGHDLRREGVTSSVPANIVVTYVQEGKEEYSVDYTGKSSSVKTEPTYNRVGQSLPDPALSPADMELVHHITDDTNEEVVFIEAESQFLQEINMDDLNVATQIVGDMGSQQDMATLQGMDGQGIASHSIAGQGLAGQGLAGHPGDLAEMKDNLSVVQESSSAQILENIMALPGTADGQHYDGQHYTYILSAEEAENMINAGQLQVNLPPEGEMVPAPGSLLPDGNPTLTPTPLPPAPPTETMVEVTPPPGATAQQYAILLVPSAANQEPAIQETPEAAAISMLQLQQSALQ